MKLIVDARELKEGETLSSGGIRENGRIISQYKNPRPYFEGRDIAFVTLAMQRERSEFSYLIEYAATDTLRLLWVELGKPVLRSLAHQARIAITCKIESLPLPGQIKGITGKSSIM